MWGNNGGSCYYVLLPCSERAEALLSSESRPERGRKGLLGSPGLTEAMLEPASPTTRELGRELPGGAGRWCSANRDGRAGQSLGLRLTDEEAFL